MSLSLYNIRKWYRMLSGRSIYHVRQGMGRCFSANRVEGYYNDLTSKVTLRPQLLGTADIPKFKTATGDEVHFPVEIIQYGLGAYDLYLISKEQAYLDKFTQCVEWALLNQEKSGAWNNFFFIYPEAPYGAMVQGEGASLLLRAYNETERQEYLTAAAQALDFMLKPIEEGGTTEYEEQGPVLKEYTHLPTVLNGWIFAWWGLYDYVKTTGDEAQYRKAMEQSCEALIASLPHFTRKFWSLYDTGGHMASPHYQTIHIAQMQAMYQLTGREEFAYYSELWTKCQKNLFYKSLAFGIKAYQKIIE